MVTVSVLSEKSPRLWLKDPSPTNANAHGLKTWHERHNDIMDIYYVKAWFSTEQGIGTKIVKDWECYIGWTVLQRKNKDGKQCWKTVDHFSMLPHGWIPENGVDFFHNFLLHLKDTWQGLCDRAHECLFDLVSLPISLSYLDANQLLYGIASRCPQCKRN
jgi:hypothetical protein